MAQNSNYLTIEEALVLYEQELDRMNCEEEYEKASKRSSTPLLVKYSSEQSSNRLPVVHDCQNILETCVYTAYKPTDYPPVALPYDPFALKNILKLFWFFKQK